MCPALRGAKKVCTEVFALSFPLPQCLSPRGGSCPRGRLDPGAACVRKAAASLAFPPCLLQDLFSALIKGPTRTPYEDGLYLFDIQLPNIYPAVPPHFCYLSQCSGRLNPNLYDNGKVCVSLLGTWIGKVGTVPPPVGAGEGPSGQSGRSALCVPVFQGTERWTSKSSLLQVLISIQGRQAGQGG